MKYLTGRRIRQDNSTKVLLHILNSVPRENYEQLLFREISLPKEFGVFLTRLFKKPKILILTGEESNEYFKSFSFLECEISKLNMPSLIFLNYLEVGNFLKVARVVIKQNK